VYFDSLQLVTGIKLKILTLHTTYWTNGKKEVGKDRYDCGLRVSLGTDFIICGQQWNHFACPRQPIAWHRETLSRSGLTQHSQWLKNSKSLLWSRVSLSELKSSRFHTLLEVNHEHKSYGSTRQQNKLDYGSTEKKNLVKKHMIAINLSAWKHCLLSLINIWISLHVLFAYVLAQKDTNLQ